MGISATSARKPHSSLPEAVLSSLCSLSVLTGPWGTHPIVPGIVISVCVSPTSPGGAASLAYSQKCSQKQPVGWTEEPRFQGLRESEWGLRLRGQAWALLTEDSQARGAAAGAGVWSALTSGRQAYLWFQSVQPGEGPASSPGFVGRLLPGLAGLWWGLGACSCMPQAPGPPLRRAHASRRLL